MLTAMVQSPMAAKGTSADELCIDAQLLCGQFMGGIFFSFAEIHVYKGQKLETYVIVQSMQNMRNISKITENVKYAEYERNMQNTAMDVLGSRPSCKTTT